MTALTPKVPPAGPFPGAGLVRIDPVGPALSSWPAEGAAGAAPRPLGLDDWLALAVCAEDAAEVRAAVAQALAAGGALGVSFRGPGRGPGGAAGPWLQLSAVPGGPDGTWIGSLQDVTPAVSAAEARVRRQGAEAQLRARNTLAAIRALIRLDAGPGPPDADGWALVEGRVGALARVLVGSGRGVPGGVPLEAILRDELLAAVAEHEVAIEGPPVGLRFGAAQAMAIAFHDLAASATLRGALGGALDGAPGAGNGRLAVSWRVEGAPEAPELALDWIESGLEELGTEGIGLGLVERMLGYGHGGRVRGERREDGFACRIRLPLPDPASAPGPGEGNPGPAGTIP